MIILLCRKALLVELYVHKQGSRERGNAWEMILYVYNIRSHGEVSETEETKVFL